MEDGRTLGSPLAFLVRNENIKKQDYDAFRDVPRPGHADYTYLKKYGIKASSGGGRSSARETIARVIAGSVAKQYLSGMGIGFASWVHSVGTHSIPLEENRSFSTDASMQLGRGSATNK
jgi:chorismate synthase